MIWKVEETKMDEKLFGWSYWLGAKIIAGSCTKVKNNIDPNIASGLGQFNLRFLWERKQICIL